MDLNYLLHRHQISLIRASEADACDVRAIHLRFVDAYASRIDEIGAQTGAGAMLLART